MAETAPKVVIKLAVHNVQIVNLGAPVYKNALCRIQRHLLWNRINRVWDTGSYFEPNSIDTEL